MRVSRRVLPTVPGWRVTRANTQTVTPDTQTGYIQNYVNCKDTFPFLSFACSLLPIISQITGDQDVLSGPDNYSQGTDSRYFILWIFFFFPSIGN
jgi:hypothetical protein